MHVSLEQFQALMEKACAAEERVDWSEHILSCDHCSRDFRALHALHRSRRPSSAPKLLTYVAGVAAVLAMAMIPYFRNAPHTTPNRGNTVEQMMVMEQAPDPIELMARVQQINYNHALSHWGQGTNLTELVALRNSSQ